MMNNAERETFSRDEIRRRMVFSIIKKDTNYIIISTRKSLGKPLPTATGSSDNKVDPVQAFAPDFFSCPTVFRSSRFSNPETLPVEPFSFRHT